MAKKKYYAVAVGRAPGIYKELGRAKKQVEGFSGAIWKKFNDKTSAKKFLHEKVVI